ncbi:uncharacterized protein LOC125064562 [Vanessa atalanta]|uniref:uncharacterized protein LOC125064562 n=1 Tax=Vanessa atalanta TaxID=42275 RepID=UPI001FCE06E6|nr:uncharacterized protein LOC125064562 [Vanessa atalanta]
MDNVRNFKFLLLGSFVVTIVYTIYPKLYIGTSEPIQKYRKEIFIQFYNGTEDFLIDTPGCFIPNYMKTMKFKEVHDAKKRCGKRAVFIKKISNDVVLFTINEIKMRYYTKKKYSCCYQFAGPSYVSGKIDYTSLRYSSCIDFKNGTETFLKEEVITVKCKHNSDKKVIIYEDAYAILKKIKRTYEKRDDERPWNILILGMDTISRGRAYSSLPKTTDYMLRHDWLDYRGYQKVGYNTFPNVMSLLTGKNMSTIYKACSSGMDKCNHMILWSQFQKAGYVTATGEDYLRLPDTFGKYGYKTSPTDHYLRPLFLTGEHSYGNLVCTKKMASPNHILDYATAFSDTYKDDKFFGMFWFNSYSHNLENKPQLIDDGIINFFNNLNSSGVMNNTFILFLSDHGMRYGKMREQVESYYAERLPMLFMWVPEDFRKIHSQEYTNLEINQNRLITPYDLRLTLWDIMVKSKITTHKIDSEACPKCDSIFNEISPYRNCADANVDEKWCTCHTMKSVDQKDKDVKLSIDFVVTYLQNKTKYIETTSCMKCAMLNLKTILRTHTYRDESLNSTYFVLGLLMTPANIGYEATIVKRNGELSIMQPTYTITSYNTRGNCVIEPNHRSYCVCEKKAKCKIKQ